MLLREQSLCHKGVLVQLNTKNAYDKKQNQTKTEMFVL